MSHAAFEFGAFIQIVKYAVDNGREQSRTDDRDNDFFFHFAPEGNAPDDAGAVVYARAFIAPLLVRKYAVYLVRMRS